MDEIYDLLDKIETEIENESNPSGSEVA